jgi:predicted transcriptional regulator
MAPFLPYQPKTLSLGPLEAEIVEILWQLEPTSVTAIHQFILEDIDRELTYSSVSTVLKRLLKKGWVSCDRTSSTAVIATDQAASSETPSSEQSKSRVQIWRSRISRQQAAILQAHAQLHRFLAVGSPEIVAAFADTLDDESLAQIDAIAQKIKEARKAREQAP